MWLSRGAQPSEQAASLLRSLGISMQRTPVSVRKAAESVGQPAGEPVAKKTHRRAAARPVSARKTQKKVARKAVKKKKTSATA